MYFGKFIKCRDYRNVLFTGLLGKGIDSRPGGKCEISLDISMVVRREKALKTEQGVWEV